MLDILLSFGIIISGASSFWKKLLINNQFQCNFHSIIFGMRYEFRSATNISASQSFLGLLAVGFKNVWVLSEVSLSEPPIGPQWSEG